MLILNKKNTYFVWLFIIGLLLGLLTGGLLGVAAGLLFTPKEGSEFRRDLKEKLKDFSNQFWKKIKSTGTSPIED